MSDVAGSCSAHTRTHVHEWGGMAHAGERGVQDATCVCRTRGEWSAALFSPPVTAASCALALADIAATFGSCASAVV